MYAGETGELDLATRLRSFAGHSKCKDQTRSLIPEPQRSRPVAWMHKELERRFLCQGCHVLGSSRPVGSWLTLVRSSEQLPETLETLKAPELLDHESRTSG